MKPQLPPGILRVRLSNIGARRLLQASSRICHPPIPGSSRLHSTRHPTGIPNPEASEPQPSTLPVPYSHTQTFSAKHGSSRSISFTASPPLSESVSSSWDSATSDTASGSNIPPSETTLVPAATGPSSPSPLTCPKYPINPFDTWGFFKILEQTFPTPVAKILMNATRAILLDRIRETNNVALDYKDYDNQAYLFKAALSEMRTELTLRTRKETASVRTALAGLRKEVDTLEGKLKEDIGSLKHEIQMDMNNRKAESRAESKARELAIETFLHRTIVTLGDLRTEIEQVKWHNTRRGVGVILTFVAFVIAAMELTPKRPPAPPPLPPAPIIQQAPLPDIRGLEESDA